MQCSRNTSFDDSFSRGCQELRATQDLRAKMASLAFRDLRACQERPAREASEASLGKGGLLDPQVQLDPAEKPGLKDQMVCL